MTGMISVHRLHVSNYQVHYGLALFRLRQYQAKQKTDTQKIVYLFDVKLT